MSDARFLEVSAWRPADPKLMISKLEADDKRRSMGLWIIDSGIAPVDLYVYLYARFGPPNGFLMTMKAPSSDNLTHWHWSLQVDERIIEFMGYTLCAKAAVEESSDASPQEVDQLTAAIKSDFANHAEGMARERKRLERWTVFINPYCRLQRVVDRFGDRLQELDILNVPLPPMPRTEEEMLAFPDRMAACIQAYSEALGLSTSLRMLAPILAESFVNLVIFILVPATTREDSRLYDSLFRQEVDVRVRSLHLNCRGFQKPVDVKDARFKSFQSLMQHRNDFLHGNISPDKLAFREVFFDGTIPLPKKYENMAELALVHSLRHVEPETAISDIGTANDFIVLVLEATHEQVAKTILHFMETLDPGWLAAEKRSGILFPPNIVFSMPGPRASEIRDQGATPVGPDDTDHGSTGS